MTMVNPYNYARPKNVLSSKTNLQKPTTIKPLTNKINKSDSYLEQKVMSAKPEELTLMLYEGIVKFISQAKKFHDKKEYDRSNNAILRAEAIIEELRATLNMDIEISNNLEQLYVFMNERLIDANMNKDNEILDEVLDLALDLKDTWKEAMSL